MTIDLRYGDTIEQMKLIPDKSIDFICCDLPYGMTAPKWDEHIDMVELWKQYQISRNKFEYEKDIFDLTDTLYALQCHKNAVSIEIENHWKSFWVKVKETKTKYKFEIWYAS